MGTLVTYRDLPGGPTKIKFADEISRHCLCRKCQMLSLCMYTDTASHMFCDNCLNDQSYKHKKYEIYCPDERKEVSLAEMFEARDLVTILRDQYVECPNQPKCTVKLPLGQLENHYIECKEISSIKCTKCGQEVPSTLWIEHKTKCQVTCDEFTLKASDNRGAKRKPPPASSASPPFSSSRKNKSTKSTTAAASLPYPSSQRADATTGELNQQFPQIGHASTSTQPSVKPKFPTSAEPEKTTCKHCERKVKESNMPRHLEVCYKIPVPCPYCEKAISRSDLKAHVEQCEREFEARKTSDATAASSEKLNKKQKKETTKTMRDGDSSHPGTYSNAQAAYSGSKTSITVEGRGTPGESSSHTGQEPQLCSGWSTNVDTWLPHATAGNWYAAYVAIEEQFKDTRTKQAARYAHFVPKLITLKLDHMVRDFIDAPYEPQPFDCLITALFARACLPLNVWPQGSEVTWDDILKYVPSVLHSRLSEDAKLYLRRHPVIPKDLNYVMVDEVGIDAAEADVPGDTSSVTSSNRAITETEASDAPEEDMRYLAAAKQPELDPLQALGKKEEAPDSEKAKKLSVAELPDDITSTLGAINIHEILSETGFRGEGGRVKKHDQTQELILKGTHERESDETDRSACGLGSGLVSSEQKSSTALQNASSSHHSEPSAAEPAVESLSATKDDSHSTEVKQRCRMTCAEAVKVPNPTPTTTGAFPHDRDDPHENGHRKRGSYEYSESSSSQTRSRICENKPVYSAVAQDRKISPHTIPGHMGGEVPSCNQTNKGYSTETPQEDSKAKYVTGSPLTVSLSEEIPSTHANFPREQIEDLQTHALGSGSTSYDTPQGRSSQGAWIVQSREGGCEKTHEQTQQELSLKGTHERESDETDRSASGLSSRLVSTEQKSNAAIQSASSPMHSGPSAAEPVESLAATKDNSDRSEVKQPCRITCAEAVTVPNPTPATTGAFHLDRDDAQESCHRKCGSYEYSESSSSKTQNCICEDKPAYSAVAQDIKINPHSIPGHMVRGVPSCHQPNKDFSSEAADEDSKPKYVVGSSLTESVSEEIPPTPFNIQREQIENHQTHAPGNGNTKCETSRGRSPQNARIFRNSTMKKKHGNNGVTDEFRAGTTITAARYRSRNTAVSLSHLDLKEKSLGRNLRNSNVNLELENTIRQLRLEYFSKLLGADSGPRSFTHIQKTHNCEESDDRLMSEVSKHHCESGENNGNHSQGTRKRTQTSAISQAPKEEPAKVVNATFSKTDTATTAPDATHRKDDVDSTVLAPQFQASTYTPLETQVTARSKFQTNIICSLPLACHGDTVTDLHRIDTGRRISQELYSQTAKSSVDACSQTPEQAEQSVDDVSNNLEKSFSDSFSSQETEV
ncbi:uncharacterized protein LOC119464238 isoform X3 [Dermacentor silvarum]|uniref:uncharacterized protein LOC119464238 isoform X3 n=1 Tax=Dermacentor silvarum TaxID=543639 RepID=UPI001899B701|nr:uncharacterized protein LOC119464238 isoform X3 [Dermacentor silvarum]